jgi:hypothetical protein
MFWINEKQVRIKANTTEQIEGTANLTERLDT